MPESLFNKVAGLKPATLLKKRLRHSCFPVNFAKFLRKPFAIEHLCWLLLNTEKHSVLIGLTLGHLRYHLTDVPPQPNSQSDSVFDTNRLANGTLILENESRSSAFTDNEMRNNPNMIHKIICKIEE